jgi:hypothetical protein
MVNWYVSSQKLLAVDSVLFNGIQIDVKLAQPRGARNDANVYGQSGAQGQQQNDFSGGGVTDGGANSVTQNPMAGMGNSSFDPQVSSPPYHPF